MAANVFGIPITTSYLAEMPEYQCYFGYGSECGRAKVTIEKKNTEGKDIAARNFVKQLRDNAFRKNNLGGTMCLVYNATGNMVFFYHAVYWEGNACESHCPLLIDNGQWGAFFIESAIKSTSAAFIYEGVNSVGHKVHWVTAFSASRSYNTLVSAEIRCPSYYSCVDDDAVEWRSLKERHLKRGHHCIVHDAERASMYASIGETESPMLEVILTLPGVVN